MVPSIFDSNYNHVLQYAFKRPKSSNVLHLVILFSKCARTLSFETNCPEFEMPYRPGGWVLHQPPWSFGFDCQTRGTRENRRTLCSSTGFLTSQPRPGWAPDPPMVGIRSPIGLVVGSCTSHAGG
jgi:hypothetical protein